MERYKHTELEILFNKMTVTELKELMQKIADKEIELVYGTDGVKGWSQNGLYCLEKAKAGKVEITKNFPVFCNDKNELITKDNLAKTDLKTIKTAETVSRELNKEATDD